MPTGTSLSRGLGVYYALNFANWVMKIVGPSVASASPATFPLATGSANLGDGTAIIPFTVGAPISIGTGSGLETVNVTSFTSVFPDSNSASVSANTSNAHGQGDIIQSGSAGLCEACALAASQGSGGVVVVDNLWVAAGGTTANIATAKALFPGVTIDNKTGASGTSVAEVALTTAQLKALQTTGIQLAAAGGTDTMLVPLKMSIQYKFVTPAYTIANADNTLQVEYVGKSTLLMSVLATGVFDQSANAVAVGGLPAVISVNLAQSNAANLGLEVKLTGTSPALTSGNGTAVLTLTYQTVTLL